MLIIPLGQIDRSIPWVVTIGGMISTAAVFTRASCLLTVALKKIAR